MCPISDEHSSLSCNNCLHSHAKYAILFLKFGHNVFLELYKHCGNSYMDCVIGICNNKVKILSILPFCTSSVSIKTHTSIL